MAKMAGLHTRHLKIVDNNFYRGQRAICTAQNRINCDKGWKPYDCRYYPLYPVVAADGRLSELTFDPFCPLSEEALTRHRSVVANVIAKQIKNRPDLVEFFSHDELGDFAPPQSFSELTHLLGHHKL